MDSQVVIKGYSALSLLVLSTLHGLLHSLLRYKHTTEHSKFSDSKVMSIATIFVDPENIYKQFLFTKKVVAITVIQIVVK